MNEGPNEQLSDVSVEEFNIFQWHGNSKQIISNKMCTFWLKRWKIKLTLSPLQSRILLLLTPIEAILFLKFWEKVFQNFLEDFRRQEEFSGITPKISGESWCHQKNFLSERTINATGAVLRPNEAHQKLIGNIKDQTYP